MQRHHLMSMVRRSPVATLGLTLCAAGCTSPPPLDTISVPDGFSIEVFASDVPNARQMALGEGGTVFVGTRTDGRVWALVDDDEDGTADRRYQLAELRMPSGVAFRDGAYRERARQPRR